MAYAAGFGPVPCPCFTGFFSNLHGKVLLMCMLSVGLTCYLQEAAGLQLQNQLYVALCSTCKQLQAVAHMQHH